MTGIPRETGVVDTLDRETGEFLCANQTVAQNVITHIDGATGDVTVARRAPGSSTFNIASATGTACG